MTNQTNDIMTCPNCGAPIDGLKCKYCGCIQWNIADISDKDFKYIRLPIGDKMGLFRVRATGYNLEVINNDEVFYNDNRPYFAISKPTYTLHIDMTVAPNEEGIIYMLKEKEKKENDEISK